MCEGSVASVCQENRAGVTGRMNRGRRRTDAAWKAPRTKLQTFHCELRRISSSSSSGVGSRTCSSVCCHSRVSCACVCIFAAMTLSDLVAI